MLGYVNSLEDVPPRADLIVTESENVEEPDMKGIEEGVVNNKTDEMHPGRGRVRTSSQVFAPKEPNSR